MASVAITAGLGLAAIASASEADPGLRPTQTQDQANTDKQTQFGLWTVTCATVPEGEPKKCAARLAIRDNARNVTVLNWLIGHNKDGTLLMEITTPVDVMIAPGLKMAIADNPPQSFAYLSCALAGCLTRIQPDEGMLDNLRKADTVKLTIDTTAGKAITFSVKIAGISESLDALAAR